MDCEAIDTITKQCWPNIIDILDFTIQESDILEEYCNKTNDSPSLRHCHSLMLELSKLYFHKNIVL